MRASFVSRSQNSSGWNEKAGGLEAEESLFEAGPFRLDDAPGEAGGKHPLRHFRKHAVILERSERFWVGLRRHEAIERRGAALALFGAGANGVEGHHASDPYLPKSAARGRPPILIARRLTRDGASADASGETHAGINHRRFPERPACATSTS